MADDSNPMGRRWSEETLVGHVTVLNGGALDLKLYRRGDVPEDPQLSAGLMTTEPETIRELGMTFMRAAREMEKAREDDSS